MGDTPAGCTQDKLFDLLERTKWNHPQRKRRDRARGHNDYDSFRHRESSLRWRVCGTRVSVPPEEYDTSPGLPGLRESGKATVGTPGGTTLTLKTEDNEDNLCDQPGGMAHRRGDVPAFPCRLPREPHGFHHHGGHHRLQMERGWKRC